MSSARKAAFEAGRKTYIGKPCPQGHDGRRYTRTCRCVECNRMWAVAANPWRRWWRQTHHEHFLKLERERQKRYRIHHSDLLAQRKVHHRAVQINTLRAIYGRTL